MSVLSNLFRPLLGAGANLPVNDERAWSTWGGPESAAGMPVTADTALKVSTVYACVRLISDSVGMLPLFVYERLANGDRRKAPTHPLYDLLHSQPNYKQTAFQFRKTLTAHLLLRGNAYARIVAGPRGFVDQLLTLQPDRMTVEALGEDRLRYLYLPPNQAERVPYTDDEIFHLRGLSMDGNTGVSVIQYARETFGTALARERYAGRFYSADSRPGGVLKTSGKLSDKAAARMGEEWAALHGGLNNAHRVAVLEEGLEYQPIGLNQRDAQFIESTEATAEQIAGQWFGVPPHMVGLTSKATSWGSGIEEMSLGFVTYTLQPWLTEWTQSTARDLVLVESKYFADFVTDALLRGRTLDRYNAYNLARGMGVLNPNEIRRLENMPQREDGGGDDYQAVLPGTAPQPAPEPDGDDGAEQAHYERLLVESAGRVVRKEIAALDRISKRHAEGSDEWRGAANEFYASHAAYVQQALATTAAVAAAYVAEQVRQLTDIGPGARLAWDPQRAHALARAVKETSP